MVVVSQKPNFSPIFDLYSKRFKNIAARILVCDASDGERGSSFDNSGAYILSSSFLKSHGYLLFAVERLYQQTFIAQSILSLVNEQADASWIRTEQETTEAAILEYIKQSMELEKHFSQKCKEGLKGKKKQEKILTFGY